MIEKLKGYRTYISAAAIVLSAVAAFLAGEASLIEAITAIATGTGLAGLRAAK